MMFVYIDLCEGGPLPGFIRQLAGGPCFETLYQCRLVYPVFLNPLSFHVKHRLGMGSGRSGQLADCSTTCRAIHNGLPTISYWYNLRHFLASAASVPAG